MGRGGATQAGQNIPRQAPAGLAVGAGGFIDRTAGVEGKERLDLTDHLAARAVGVEHLIEEAKEGAPNAENAFSAVGALLSLRQQGWGQERAEELVQMKEALLAQANDAPAHGAEPVSPVGEEGCMHCTVLLLCQA
ncbi:MAG TPA: hypothetical protein VG167_05030 [Verrucomicrobiae bacterium]|nr:hypothetical protein [Verrucomicrobiae bacterium]